MLGTKRALMFENGNRKQSPTLILALVLMACAFFGTGCSGLPQSSGASSQASAEQPISMENVLPAASVGSSYHAVVSVSGGRAPYNFVVSQGELPVGLVLNPLTGSLAGIPTRAGSFTFTITVRAAAVGGFGTRAYTMTVAPSVNSVTVQISPADPSIATGGKLQFAAAVSNTSNTAVSWSASAGTISSSGLFTAPASGSAKSITVTARSAAQSTVQASTVVTITNPITNSPFAITTSSVPSAVEATPYSASLTASGGQPPYRWSIASGSLPAGLQLDASTGTLSGSATKGGTFAFSVLGTDAASHTAQRSLSLRVSTSLVSTSGKTCGPPAYDCSRTDLSIVQVPQAPPSMGNLSGANTIVTDPDFGNRIVRITDANTNPEAPFKNRTYETAASGSADENLWNVDSTLFIVQDSGSNSYPFSFNPSTLQAARMYVSSFPATNGFRLSDSGIWSRVNPNVLYTFAGTAINKYDFTDRTSPPSPQLVYDFTSSRNCLPAGFTKTWSANGGVSSDDSVIGMGYSNNGNQGTGVSVVAYKAGSGCSTLNTQTGQVGGDWGAKGTINIADRWSIHNVKMSKDGNWMVIVSTKCLSSTCVQGPYFWQIGTTNVISCQDGGRCGGHWTEGSTHWVNNDDSPLSNQVIRTFSEPTSVTSLTHIFPPGITDNFDQHQSWNNVDAADTLPFVSSTWSPVHSFPAPWYDEIIAVAADGSGKTWRFAHSFITGNSQSFSTMFGIGSVSQDGKFFVFSSDWMGELGSNSGASTCTVGTNCRGDVFVVELR